MAKPLFSRHLRAPSTLPTPGKVGKVATFFPRRFGARVAGGVFQTPSRDGGEGGNMTQIQDAYQHKTTFTFDQFGHQLTRTLALMPAAKSSSPPEARSIPLRAGCHRRSMPSGTGTSGCLGRGLPALFVAIIVGGCRQPRVSTDPPSSFF